MCFVLTSACVCTGAVWLFQLRVCASAPPWVSFSVFTVTLPPLLTHTHTHRIMTSSSVNDDLNTHVYQSIYTHSASVLSVFCSLTFPLLCRNTFNINVLENSFKNVYMLFSPQHTNGHEEHKTCTMTSEILPLRMSSLPSSTRSEVRSFSPINCWKPNRFRQRVPKLKQNKAHVYDKT